MIKKYSFFLLLAAIILLIIFGRHITLYQYTLLDYYVFKKELKAKNILTVNIEDDRIYGICSKSMVPNCKGDNYETFIPEALLRDSKEIRELNDIFVANFGENQLGNFRVKPRQSQFWSIIFQSLPWILIFVLGWYFLIRQLRVQTQGGISEFTRSRAQIISKDKVNVTFDDVAGIEEAKEEVVEVIEFLKNPSKFRKIGARIPRGILLVGPPGTGKTLLAKAIAGEAGVPFFSISGSDFVELFVGVGAARVRDLFKRAKENAPSIIFLDEIDAVGRKRGTGLGGGHDEREQTLNQILVNMDGFDTNDNVIVIAATNRPDVLDSALLRPGRFDREIVIDLPDVKGRLEILKVHTKKVRLSHDVNLETVAKSTPFFSGAELAALVNEAAIIAAMKKRENIIQEDFEEARDKIRWGRQKKSKVMEEEDKKITAYHESGHTLLAKLLMKSEPVHKVTIIPRGMALGATMRLPEKDRYHMQKQYALNTIAVLLGGRVAEEIFCSDISAGASNDIKEATEIARKMVCEWGMSEKLGLVNYSDIEEHLFLGREIARKREHSEYSAILIDQEIKNILATCYRRARELIEKHKVFCEKLAHELLAKEVLTGKEIDAILAPILIQDRA
ncbi:MAG: ATP-dependent zinc metalloprotease FtsH [Planctomycetota bacterium]